ncbi:hypothetical protein BRAO375_1990007 [Bradyrhizobium sp. ORS 375]|nr:hypothetical protein BRAO375_1990007 [Bradyrhizobium sp. ORS 375]
MSCTVTAPTASRASELSVPIGSDARKKLAEVKPQQSDQWPCLKKTTPKPNLPDALFSLDGTRKDDFYSTTSGLDSALYFPM